MYAFIDASIGATTAVTVFIKKMNGGDVSCSDEQMDLG